MLLRTMGDGDLPSSCEAVWLQQAWVQTIIQHHQELLDTCDSLLEMTVNVLLSTRHQGQQLSS